VLGPLVLREGRAVVHGAEMRGEMTELTPDDVAREVRRIRQAASDGDSELAHQMEDALYRDVLRWAAANGDEKTARMASVAVSASELLYERWYG
jgi:hypothetical protein